VEVNEELDLELVVRRLKQDNALLRQELALLRSGAAASGDTADDAGGRAAAPPCDGAEERLELSEGEEARLRRQVQEWLEDPSPDARLSVQPSMFFIHAAFGMLKGLLTGSGAHAASGQLQQAGSGRGGEGQEARRLRVLVQEQEQQIAVLAGLLRKQGLAFGRLSDPAAAATDASGSLMPAGQARPGSSGSSSSSSRSLHPQPASSQAMPPRPASGPTSVQAQAAGALPAAGYTDALLMDQQKAVRAGVWGMYRLMLTFTHEPPRALLMSGMKQCLHLAPSSPLPPPAV
jgi:hypothetical protein